MILGVWVCLITIYGLVSIGSVYGNGLVLWIVSTTKSLQNVNNLLVANLAITGKNLTIKFYNFFFDIFSKTFILLTFLPFQ